MGKILKFLKDGLLFCIKWRYLIALVVFVICVIFNLHGSSIAEYNNLFSNSDEYNAKDVILGESRGIRSDEFIVHTPYYMSQVYNNFAKDSHAMSLEGQDMIIGYNAPVLDVAAIAKPFTWGYFLFGNERGLSWYWCSKLILLMLVTFELCMIVTKKNKIISFLGMLLISFAPAVQWWFVPHMVDVYFWGMTMLVLAYHFFTSKGRWRVLWMCLLPLSVITFVLALFPALQVPIGLSMFALFVGLLVRDKKEITFKKKDIWRIILVILVIITVLGYTIFMSKDAIKTLMSTVYPGKRVLLGGEDGVKSLFTSIVTFTLPYKDITYTNNCEVSSFIHFAPIFFMLYPVIYKKMKKDRNIIVGNVLIVCLAVMAIYMLAGFPELLAKVTGFSYIHRMHLVYGFVATIFTIWGISMIWKKQVLTEKQIWLTLLVYGFLYICFVDSDELTYLSWKYYLIIISGLLVLAHLMLTNRKKIFMFGMVLLIFVSGMTINPIARGTDSLFAHPLEMKINEIAKNEPDAYWLAVGDTTLASIGIANGAKVLNAVNFYPDFAKWRLIDPEGQNDYIYNRYAHILTFMTEEKTSFDTLSVPDAFKLELNYEDSIKWPVEYIMSVVELENNSEYYQKIYSDSEGDYYIYKRINKE